MKADWHVSQPDTGPDPFADSVLPFGSMPVSLDCTTAELDSRISDLLRREARLDDMGVSCALRDCSESTCLACPVSKLGDPDSPLSALCRIGQEQERVVTMRLAKTVGV